ncbi:MAG: LysE family transporter [Pseudomonadota bacterium]
MDAVAVLIPVFAIFIPALMLPGPDFVGVVRSATTRGLRAGLWTTAGVMLGLGFYSSLSLIGLSAVLLEYQWLAWAVRLLGGAYLCWLGIRLMLTRAQGIEIDGDRPNGNPLVFGILVTLTNPKAVVLFSSVFATAVTDTTPVWLLGLMVVIVMASAFVWYALVTLFMVSGPVLAAIGRARHWVERVAGACFLLVGGRIMADARNPLTP